MLRGVDLVSDITYVIFDSSEVDKIDFNTVLIDSAETLRYNNPGTKTFVKWTGPTPDCVVSLTTKGPYLTNEEILDILCNETEWIPIVEGPV